MHQLSNNLLFYPPDAPIGGGIEDVIDLFGEDDDPNAPPEQVVTDTEGGEDLLAEDKPKPKEKEKEEKEKPEEIELEEKEPDESDLELVTPSKRRDILKKYPELFKDFPYLEKAYYREQRYTEIFPTLEDAKLAVEKNENYDKFEKVLLDGDLNTVLKSLREANSGAFDKIVNNYLVELKKVDNTAYLHAIGDVLDNTIVALINESKASGNKNLEIAAQILHQFAFGSSQYKKKDKFGNPTETTPENEQLQRERAEFIQERFTSVQSDLATKAMNVLKSTVSQHIDPKDVMTDYVKRVAIQEVIETLDGMLANDARFQVQQNKLWERAFQDNFSPNSQNAIRSAYLSKAKTLLPQLIQKSRNAALKGLGKRVTEEREEPTRKGPVAQGRAATHSGTADSLTIKKGESTKDFFLRE